MRDNWVSGLRGSPEEVFFNYGYDKEKSYYRKRIPNSFSGTIFNRHRIQIEGREIDRDSSRIYRSVEINQQLKNVSFSPIDISQEQLNTWVGTSFEPSKLDLFVLEKIQCLMLL